MRYASAMVEKVVDGRKYVIRVRVAVERPTDSRQSYIRCASNLSNSGCSAAAWSGARFARWKVDRDYFGIEIREITGDLNAPGAADGAAIATVIATWIAYGVEWQDGDLVETYGWSLLRPIVT